MGHALARGLYAGPEPRAYQRAILEEVTGNAGLHLAGQALILLFLAAVLLAEPRYGVAALFAFHLQPLLVTLGTRARPRDLLRTLALRAPRAALTWLRLVFGSGVRAPDPIEARRAEYVRLLAGGTDRFFEPRRETCPLCEGTRLRLQLETTDLLQHKPGRFRLDRCQGCGHIFQNPRLSLEGLDFYYRDFYDGLGERNLEGIFGMSMRAYRARAQMLEGAAIHRWLDVGTGHGHFPFAARQRFPSVTFDGLDLASSVLEAERRGWIDRAYQGLFPDLADELAGQYDVVSMSHYLEHTREPEAEIAAAAKVLRPGGHLLIEVPDPECWMKDRLGRWWLPYFQPQHQHFLSTQNLARLLRAHGFEVVRWHRGEAHQPVDWLAAAVLLLGALAPGPRPWRPKRWHDRVLPFLVWPLGAPLIAAGALLDRATAERKRVPGGSNTYRVLARRAPER
ncbi:MAG: class I SAM-dependent methyltransferase [Deltaproteobacteria bacterium]|nr:MAG: class I SAM-dependent methyltransferase [Deltaproteobacteria bacterium]